MAALEFVADQAWKTRFDPNLKVGARISAVCLTHGMIAHACPAAASWALPPCWSSPLRKGTRSSRLHARRWIRSPAN
jgi:adenosylmethionine-8-amino-7-oxononanoate aminotransferase